MDLTRIPGKVTAPNAADNELVLVLPDITKKTLERPATTVVVQVISGTFKFAVGQTADDASAPTYTSTDGQIPITIIPGEANLHFKAANANEEFKISL